MQDSLRRIVAVEDRGFASSQGYSYCSLHFGIDGFEGPTGLGLLRSWLRALASAETCSVPIANSAETVQIAVSCDFEVAPSHFEHGALQKLLDPAVTFHQSP